MYDWAEFRHFVYLLKILENGGFRPAAELLRTSQPNLTVQARQFQENATVTLYRKSKDGRIHPTETGRAFIALAPLVLKIREEVIDALIEIDRGGLETLRLGCSPRVDQKLFRELCSFHKELLPNCPILPSHGDTIKLAEEVRTGTLDAALITLPVKDPDLHIEIVRRDRLVVCLRKDHPLATKTALQVDDLQRRLAILYHPQQHPEAHRRLLEMLSEQGVRIEQYSSASHPVELQMLVKEGYGFALIREGAPLDEELTTRSVVGVDWTVDMAVIFNRQRYPKTIPVLIRKLQKKIQRSSDPSWHKKPVASVPTPDEKEPDSSKHPIQLQLLR